MNLQEKYRGCYGSLVKPLGVQDWIKRSLISNIEREEAGLPKSSLNIWGIPGTAKTSIVKQLKGQKVLFDGVEQEIDVIDIPLAQIEEMGDLLGFPIEQTQVSKEEEQFWIKAIDSIISAYTKEKYGLTNKYQTTYAPPEWVPEKARPGIILFDDGNRASPRILRGLMQLVQDYRTISWALPKGYTIVFTGNPDNRFNQVSSMDSAQLTRMKHITLNIDAKEWASWASAQKGIDPRGISFVLRYEEMMVGKERTNPRTLTEFFYSLKKYPDLSNKKALEYCRIDAHASLDEETVDVILTFLLRDAEMIVEPELILDNPEEAEKKLKHLLSREEPRLDIVSISWDRLIARLSSESYTIQPGHIENFRKWVLLPENPQDLMFGSIKYMIQSGNCKHARKFVSGPEMMELAKDLLSGD